MKKAISPLLVLLILVNSVFAPGDLFAAEKIEAWEEEYAEEVVMIEDRAGTTPDEVLYIVDEVVEDITLLIKKGEDKAEYALEVKEEKVAEAALMVGENKSEEALVALVKANNVSDIVAQEVGLNLKEGAWKSAELSEEQLEKLKGKLPLEAEWEEISKLIESQQGQEEKIKIASKLAEKIGVYCDELAKLDFQLMEEDEHCDPEQAPEWLRGYVEEDLEKRQREAEEMMIGMLTTCINDPRECDCSQIPVVSEQRDCEINTRLAVRCEFERDMSACEELEGQEPMVPEGIPDFLRPIFEEKVTELIAAKEKEMFSKLAPPECIEAGLDNREDCEELMIEKYLPPECKEAGAYSKEECESLMMEKYGSPPEECMKDGRSLSREECEAIMIEKFNIPDECIKDGHPIGEEECRALTLPPECKEAGATSREECEKVMIEKHVPPECKEAGALTPEECEKVMREKRGGEGGPPEECMVDGEFIGQEECEELMRGKEGGPPPECFVKGQFIGEEECNQKRAPPSEGLPPEGCPPVCAIACEFGNQKDERGCPTCSCNPPPEKKELVEEKWPGYVVVPVREDLVLIKNPETGETEAVTREDAKQWVEENLGEPMEEIAPGEEISFLKDEIEKMETWKEEGLPAGEEFEEELEERGGAEEQLPTEEPREEETVEEEEQEETESSS